MTDPVAIGAAIQQVFGRLALAAATGVPEGIRHVLCGRRIIAGNTDFLRENGVSGFESFVADADEQGATPVLVADSGVFRGAIQRAGYGRDRGLVGPAVRSSDRHGRHGASAQLPNNPLPGLSVCGRLIDLIQ